MEAVDTSTSLEELQAVAWSLYRRAPVAGPLCSTVEEIWDQFGAPSGVELTGDELESVTFFHATPSFHLKRKAQLDQLWAAVNRLLETGSLRGVVLQPPKYKASLPRVDAPSRRIELDLPGQLEQELVGYPVSANSLYLRGRVIPSWARPAEAWSFLTAASVTVLK